MRCEVARTHKNSNKSTRCGRMQTPTHTQILKGFHQSTHVLLLSKRCTDTSFTNINHTPTDTLRTSHHVQHHDGLTSSEPRPGTCSAARQQPTRSTSQQSAGLDQERISGTFRGVVIPSAVISIQVLSTGITFDQLDNRVDFAKFFLMRLHNVCRRHARKFSDCFLIGQVAVGFPILRYRVY